MFALCVVPFVLLATLNSGGYRYGASDQAFYQPAVLAQLDPTLFPRDIEVLEAQMHLTLADETMAMLVRITGLSVPAVFALLYAGSLALFAWAVWLIGTRLYTSTWTTVALLAAFTLRHAIARSGTNTLEGYFQPRLLAYALGAAGIAAFLRGRMGLTSALILMAAAVHPTTAAWFAIWLVVAAAIAMPEWRRTAYAIMAVAAAAAAWLLFGGPLTSRLGILDAEWRQLLETKTYLFPLAWPAYAWILNIGYLALIAWIYGRRQRAGLVGAQERGLVLGSAALVAVFIGALAAQAIGIALAFQLQPARVFWMFDFLATTYVIWWLASSGSALERHARVVALVVLAFSVTRGVYVIVEAERPAVQLTIPDDDWGRVMAFARTTDPGSGWLADPLHAVRYGTSVRVAGERDVLVESVKDTALGMYDRRIAVRTGERFRAAGDYDALTPEAARRLGQRYDLDYMVTERSLELPLVFTSGDLRVYRLRE